MRAIDTSILAFAINRFAPEHARAARLIEQIAAGDQAWALPAPVIREFLERVTHPHAVARALRPLDALAFVDELLGSPSARLIAPGERHAESLREALELAGSPAQVPPGLELAAVLREHGVRELLSADPAMRRFPFLEVRDPLQGPEWSPDERPARRYRVLGVRRPRASTSVRTSNRERNRP